MIGKEPQQRSSARLLRLGRHLGYHDLPINSIRQQACHAYNTPAHLSNVCGKTKKMGFGILGSGSIARSSFAPSLLASDSCDLVAVCRRDRAKAQQFATLHGEGCAAYSSAAELLRDPAVEAVLIATPTHTHKEFTLMAAQHGKHVLVEKPMARNAEECNEMIAACNAAGVTLGVCYRRRTFPQVLAAKQLVTEGKIGQVLHVRTHCSALTEKLKKESRGGESFSDVWADEPVLGGAMMEMASHRIEVLLNLIGLLPESVSALVETTHPQHKHWLEEGVDDSDALLLRFPDGKIGMHSTTLTTPPRRDMAYIEGTLGRISAS